jgi:hypothetical protein
MAVCRHYSKEELARRGQELYESSIRQQVESGNTDKILVIDIEIEQLSYIHKYMK